jgi:putative holliday junction resolvase
MVAFLRFSCAQSSGAANSMPGLDPGLPVSKSLPSKARSAVLAIDYGRRRLGLAISDGLAITARPLATWTRSNRRRDVSRLRELCRALNVATVIVGWPLHLDGRPGEMATEATRFADRVRKELGLPVELVDERLSSHEARAALAEASSMGLRGRRRNETLDDVAAAVILRDYLAHKSKSTLLPDPPQQSFKPARTGPRENTFPAPARRPRRS